MEGITVIWGGSDSRFRYIVLMTVFVLMQTIVVNSGFTEAQPQKDPATVMVGVRLVNIEKVDLASNSYRPDFYIWFIFNASEISLADVKDFEFINGAPTMYEIYANETDGFLEYRAKGDFVKTFDCSKYPFDSHDLVVEVEHKNMNTSYLVYTTDPDSSVDGGVNVVGFEIERFETYIVEHVFSGTEFSKFVFCVTTQRPMLSSFIKSVLPISIITSISLLAFFIPPHRFFERMSIGVTTLLSATAFHLSLISGLPPTGYLTLADRIMISVYVIFLFNLATSVYLMKLVEAKKADEAASFDARAEKILVLLIIALVAVQFLF
jgi:hypothetical protein